jgi:hypothetical protein
MSHHTLGCWHLRTVLASRRDWSKLLRMICRLCLMCALSASIVSFGMVGECLAQSADKSEGPQNGIVLSKLSPPVYPRLAQQARIAGDVNLILGIRSDGNVDSVVVVSGHPMLKQAAQESALHSLFECHGCRDGISSYPLKYQFQITSRDPPKDCLNGIDGPAPPVEIDPASHKVSVFAWELWTCDPTAVHYKVRSAKCLYLWKCSLREKVEN